MISAVIQRGTEVHVYNERGQIVKCIYIGNNGMLLGFTGTTVTVKREDTAYVYNDKGSVIKTFYAKS